MQLVHLALAENGLVIAHFMGAADASKFCLDNGLRHLAYNLGNPSGLYAPVVGSIYKDRQNEMASCKIKEIHAGGMRHPGPISNEAFIASLSANEPK